MNTEKMLKNEAASLLPTGCGKAVFYVALTETSAELFFYAWDGGKPVQCYTLAEEGRVDGAALERSFDKMAVLLRASDGFRKDSMNLFTLVFENSMFLLETEYLEKDVRLYAMKKAWKEKWLAEKK